MNSPNSIQLLGGLLSLSTPSSALGLEGGTWMPGAGVSGAFANWLGQAMQSQPQAEARIFSQGLMDASTGQDFAAEGRALPQIAESSADLDKLTAWLQDILQGEPAAMRGLSNEEQAWLQQTLRAWSNLHQEGGAVPENEKWTTSPALENLKNQWQLLSDQLESSGRLPLQAWSSQTLSEAQELAAQAETGLEAESLDSMLRLLVSMLNPQAPADQAASSAQTAQVDAVSEQGLEVQMEASLESSSPAEALSTPLTQPDEVDPQEVASSSTAMETARASQRAAEEVLQAIRDKLLARQEARAEALGPGQAKGQLTALAEALRSLGMGRPDPVLKGEADGIRNSDAATSTPLETAALPESSSLAALVNPRLAASESMLNAATASQTQIPQPSLLAQAVNQVVNGTLDAEAEVEGLNPEPKAVLREVTLAETVGRQVEPGSARAEASASNSAAQTTSVSGLSAQASSLNVAAPTQEGLTAKTASESLESQRQLLNPNFARILGERSLMMVQQGPRVAEIRLDPPELGSLRIRVHLQGNDQVSLSFTASNAAVREAIEQQLPRLREMFSGQGMQLADASVSDQSPEQERQASSARKGRSYGRESAEADLEGLPQTLKPLGLVDYYA
ncbi:flagellar hook-length control protein FliK [Nitrincola tapanii]|nr:flagellar hook-length control protein FliK [Nitrincola tapanii]